MTWSYTRQVKAELAHTALGSLPCCWAELWGLSGRDDDPSETGGLWVRAGSAFVSRRAYRLMKHLELDPVMRVGKHLSRVEFTLWGNDVPPPDIEQSVVHCPEGIVRGAFLLKGYVSELDRPVHWEIQAPSAGWATVVSTAMASLGVTPRVSSRRGVPLIYLKDHERVAFLLGRIGAHQTILDMESQSVVRSMKNQVNRLVNSETANMKRSVEAALKDGERILAVKGRSSWARLAPDLKALAELRLSHPEWSFEELGRHLHPPLTKSAVNHRLRKLRTWLEKDAGNR